MEKQITGESIVKQIMSIGMKSGMDMSRAFSEMLDAFIDFLSIERLQACNCDMAQVMESIKDHKWCETYGMWLNWVYRRQSNGKVVDAFDFYEESVKSKGKASALGQFYTPQPICDMMAEMQYQAGNEVALIHDSAVGSGRTLLGYANVLQKKKSPEVAYYIANDIDEQSVKMCTLNFAINGMYGRVLCADGLLLHYNWGYEINETKYPMHTDMLSIRRLPDSKHSGDHEERQMECNYWLQLEKERREKLQALYQCRIGNPDPCINMIPESANLVERICAEEQLINLSQAMAKYYNIEPKEKPEPEPQPVEEIKPIEKPKQAEPKQWVQMSLFD